MILTTYDAAQTVCDPSVIGVLRDWSLPNLLPLVRSLQNIRTDILHIQGQTMWQWLYSLAFSIWLKD